jgi:hypothetical protein
MLAVPNLFLTSTRSPFLSVYCRKIKPPVKISPRHKNIKQDEEER